MSRGTAGELAASKDALSALANDTGGRAFFNSNELSAAVTEGLKDASVYYLLAWRPDADEQRNPKYQRLEVSIVGRSDMVVRSRMGVGDAPSSEVKTKPDGAANPAADMREALRSAVTQAGFPVEISLDFVNTAQAADVLVASTKIPTPQLVFADEAGILTANISVAGIILNLEGKIVSTFDKLLTVRAKSAADTKNVPDIHYTSYAAVKPGLYQVRVAATDRKGGPVGTAWDWIEIPDSSAKTFALSSILVGERKTDGQEPGMKVDPTLDQVQLNVSRRFAPSSYLRFMAIVYNAKASTGNGAVGKPDLAVQVQVFRDNEPVVTNPLHAVNTDGATDLARIPYAAELNLEGLARGKYVLQLTVIDRLAKATASQRVRFKVD
jgi:hypothetical protein